MITIREAGLADMDALMPMLLADAEARHRSEPMLWPLVSDPATTLCDTLYSALSTPSPAFRQTWRLALPALKARGADAAMAVCPAAWESKTR